MLRASQQNDEEPDPDLLRVEAARSGRSKVQKPSEASSSVADGSSRWGDVSDRPIITNPNTAKQTKLGISTFITYLKESKGIIITAEELAKKPQDFVVEHLETFALQVGTVCRTARYRCGNTICTYLASLLTDIMFKALITQALHACSLTMQCSAVLSLQRQRFSLPHMLQACPDTSWPVVSFCCTATKEGWI